jgi:hypothetical protein
LTNSKALLEVLATPGSLVATAWLIVLFWFVRREAITENHADIANLASCFMILMASACVAIVALRLSHRDASILVVVLMVITCEILGLVMFIGFLSLVILWVHFIVIGIPAALYAASIWAQSRLQGNVS